MREKLREVTDQISFVVVLGRKKKKCCIKDQPDYLHF